MYIGKHQLQSQILLTSASMQDCTGNLASYSLPLHKTELNYKSSEQLLYVAIPLIENSTLSGMPVIMKV